MLINLLLIRLCTLRIRSHAKCVVLGGSEQVISTIYNIGGTFHAGTDYPVYWDGQHLELNNYASKSAVYKTAILRTNYKGLRAGESRIMRVSVCNLGISKLVMMSDAVKWLSMEGLIDENEAEVRQTLAVCKSLGVIGSLRKDEEQSMRELFGLGILQGLPYYDF